MPTVGQQKEQSNKTEVTGHTTEREKWQKGTDTFYSKVEPNCDKETGYADDGGSDSCGPFQIKKVYWIDCGRPGDSYEECTKDYECAKGCVQAYMERYGGWKCGTTCEDYARMHNGGPKGCKKSATDGYWNKIRNAGCSSDS